MVDDRANLIDNIPPPAGSKTPSLRVIGDCYMVAAGVSEPRADHARVLADMALEMRETAAHMGGDGLRFRIGLNSGPLTAGVIGRQKFLYDLWGDTVNVASRMESEGLPGQIQVTPTTRDLLADAGFDFEPRGSIDVKGKGEMNTWLLTGKA